MDLDEIQERSVIRTIIQSFDACFAQLEIHNRNYSRNDFHSQFCGMCFEGLVRCRAFGTDPFDVVRVLGQDKETQRVFRDWMGESVFVDWMGKLLSDTSLVALEPIQIPNALDRIAKTQRAEAAKRVAEAFSRGEETGEALSDALRASLNGHHKGGRGHQDADPRTAYRASLSLLAEDKHKANILKWNVGKLNASRAGLHPGDFCVVAGRPGGGKTTFALEQARLMSCRLDEGSVLYVSLEFPATTLRQWCVFSEAGVSERSVIPPEDSRLLDRAAEFLSTDSRLHIRDDAPTLVGELVGWMRTEAERIDAKLIVIDYLGLIGSKGKSQYEKVSDVSLTLRRFALQSKIPVVAVHQLNRASVKEKRRPSAHDLRDSGQIEQDATHIILLHPVSDDGAVSEVELLLEKNRRGQAPGFVKMRFDKAAHSMKEAI